MLGYMLALGMEGLCCLFAPLLHSFSLLLTFSIFYGIFDGAYVALIPVVTSDIVDSTNLTSALGVVYFLHAVPYLVSPPIGGKCSCLCWGDGSSTSISHLQHFLFSFSRLVSRQDRKLPRHLPPQRGILVVERCGPNSHQWAKTAPEVQICSSGSPKYHGSSSSTVPGRTQRACWSLGSRVIINARLSFSRRVLRVLLDSSDETLEGIDLQSHEGLASRQPERLTHVFAFCFLTPSLNMGGAQASTVASEGKITILLWNKTFFCSSFFCNQDTKERFLQSEPTGR